MTSGKLDETATQLADGVPEVVPRFTRLAPNDDSHVLIFLDDTSLLSRRAEELTLTSLGRLSASIAHEIRNPLAAIRYSAQLLAESESMDATDQRMVEIINNHCIRAQRDHREHPAAVAARTLASGDAGSGPLGAWPSSRNTARATTSAPISCARSPAATRRWRRWPIRSNCSRWCGTWCRTRCATAACPASRRG